MYQLVLPYPEGDTSLWGSLPVEDPDRQKVSLSQTLPQYAEALDFAWQYYREVGWTPLALMPEPPPEEPASPAPEGESDPDAESESDSTESPN